MNTLVTAATLMVGTAAVAWGAPEFIVQPLMPPPTAVGQRPAIQLDAAISLGEILPDILGGYLEGQAGEVSILESTPVGGLVDARLGIEWRACRRTIVGRVYSDFEGQTAEDGDFCELLALASIDSPSPNFNLPMAPRFVLTEDAEVRISWEASATMSGSMHQGVVSFVVRDPHAIPPTSPLIAYVEHQGATGEEPWGNTGEITMALPAGDYDIHASVSHQGTMLRPSEFDFADAMSGHASLRFRIEIAGAACGGDLTGDGEVGVDDLNAVLASWGTTSASGDADCSGAVDVGDLNSVLASWSAACG